MKTEKEIRCADCGRGKTRFEKEMNIRLTVSDGKGKDLGICPKCYLNNEKERKAKEGIDSLWI